jgi:hypothetical protein
VTEKVSARIFSPQCLCRFGLRFGELRAWTRQVRWGEWRWRRNLEFPERTGFDQPLDDTGRHTGLPRQIGCGECRPILQEGQYPFSCRRHAHCLDGFALLKDDHWFGGDKRIG